MNFTTSQIRTVLRRASETQLHPQRIDVAITRDESGNIYLQPFQFDADHYLGPYLKIRARAFMRLGELDEEQLLYAANSYAKQLWELCEREFAGVE